MAEVYIFVEFVIVENKCFSIEQILRPLERSFFSLAEGCRSFTVQGPNLYPGVGHADDAINILITINWVSLFKIGNARPSLLSTALVSSIQP